MTNQEKYKQDLNNLGLGEHLSFLFEGVECIIYRHPRQYHLCAYIKVREGMSFQYAEETFHPYGGVSYLDNLTHIDPDLKGVYMGFHAGNAMDWVPGYCFGTYKDVEFMKEQVKKLVKEYKAVQGGV